MCAERAAARIEQVYFQSAHALSAGSVEGLTTAPAPWFIGSGSNGYTFAAISFVFRVAVDVRRRREALMLKRTCLLSEMLHPSRLPGFSSSSSTSLGLIAFIDKR